MSHAGDNSISGSPATLGLSEEVAQALSEFRADTDARDSGGLDSTFEVRRWEDAALVQEIFTLNNLMLRVGDRIIARHGLTSARWMLIGALEQYDEPPTISELSSDALLTVQNVSRMVRSMEQEGWVERFTVDGGGRSVHVRLTQRALKVCDDARAECQAFSSAFLAGIPEADITHIQGVLDRLIGNMDRFERILHRNGADAARRTRASGS